MPEIVEAIHKITYDVNDEGLYKAQQVLVTQLNDLLKLNTELVRLQQQLGKTADVQTQAFSRIEAGMNKLVDKLTKDGSKINDVFKGVVKGLLDGLGVGGSLDTSVKKFVEDLGKGFNTIPKGASGATKALTAAGNAANAAARSLPAVSKAASGLAMGFSLLGGPIGIAINLFLMFQDVIFDTGEEVDSYKDKVDEAAEYSKKLGEEAGGEMAQMLKLKTTVENTNLSYDKRIEAQRKLRDMYPEVFKDLSNEEILAGKVGDAYERITRSIIASARVRLNDKKLEDVLSQHTATGNLDADADLYGIKHSIDKTTGLSVYDLSEWDDGFKKMPKKYDSNSTFQYDLNNRSKVPTDVFLKLLGSNARVGLLNSLLNENATLSNDIQTSRNPSYALPDRMRATSSEEKLSRDMPRLEMLPSKLLPVEAIKQDELKPAEIPAMEDADEKREEHIKKAIADYQTLAQSVADAYNTIVQVQINALDKEIAIREKRVEAAQKLAERGNVEALRMEEERLRQAQNMREQFARRQQIVNSAITVSNAIAAVARAALEGGGFGSAATIAALIAALAAGYAAVSSMSNDNAFADGVVDYKGKGGPRDDANWVRISSGESVITADGTKANRHILEAINSGAHFKLMNPALPYTMPMFRSPDGSGVYASAQDLGALESKMDNVVNAIEDNRLRQNIYFNEHGVGIMTEKAMRRDRRRWL